MAKILAKFEDFWMGNLVKWEEVIKKPFKTLTQWYDQIPRKFYRIGEQGEPNQPMGIAFYQSKEFMKKVG